ncbi:MAG: hypothetical protein F6K56_21825 [Moorea sp. SIO3G5]|nr:hypothetical protein [Moorena sp. SIO3G5]
MFPYSLLPTPYSLLPTPCSLKPTTFHLSQLTAITTSNFMTKKVYL